VDEVQAEVRPAPAVASAIDPEAASTFFAGLEALGREDFNGAEGVFRTLLDNNAQSPLGNTGMAILLANQGREVEARERLNAVVESPKVPVEAYFMLGLLDERAARPEDALASYNRALAVDDHFLMAHFNRAWIYKRMRKDAEFKAEMHRALALLRSSPHCPAWVTGGLSFESIVALMVEAIDGEGVGGNTGKKRGADGA
jgi:chemotaxis protein methyltransferase CheR